MSFYGKYFRCLLDERRKKNAAYSTLREKFSMPTLIGRNNHVLLYNECAPCAGFSSCERVIKVKKCRISSENFLENIFPMPT